MIENALVSILRALVGNARITPSTETVLVYAELPRIIYTLSASEPNYCDDGNIALLLARYQLDVFSGTMTEGRSIIDTLHKPYGQGGLDGYSGTVDGTRIERIWFGGAGFNTGEQVPGGKTISRFSEGISVYYRENY